MPRLTDRFGTFMIEDTGPDPYATIEMLCEKLGPLENFEDDMGTDLETILKAIHNGIWYKDEPTGLILQFSENIDSMYEVFISRAGIVLCVEGIMNRTLFYSDYGKTWALEKEELG